MKKLLSIFICLSVSFSLLACANNSNNAEPSDTVDVNGENDVEQYLENPASDFHYTTMIIAGKDTALITQYVGESKNVVIPREIDGYPVGDLSGASLGDGDWMGVFQNSDIETVVIPETVRNIGPRCFMNCHSLTSVTVMPGIKLDAVDTSAFENCYSLKSINLENSPKITSIGLNAFCNCTSLESVRLPSKLQSITMRAFFNCTSLKSIELPETLKTIGEAAFSQCTSLEKIELPSNLKRIDAYAFSKCTSLKSVNIPDKIELQFSDTVFRCVDKLTDVVFDEGRSFVYSGFYSYFQLTSDINVTVPKGVKIFDINIFESDHAVNINFLGDCPEFENAENYQGNVTVYYDPNTKGWDTTPVREFFTLIPY